MARYLTCKIHYDDGCEMRYAAGQIVRKDPIKTCCIALHKDGDMAGGVCLFTGVFLCRGREVQQKLAIVFFDGGIATAP